MVASSAALQKGSQQNLTMTSELHCACTLLVQQLISQSDNFYVFCLCVVFVFCTFCNDLRSASCLRASSKLQCISPSDKFYNSPEMQTSECIAFNESVQSQEPRVIESWIPKVSELFVRIWAVWIGAQSGSRHLQLQGHDHDLTGIQLSCSTSMRGCGVTEKETLGPYPVPHISAVYAMVRDNCV